MKIFVIGGGGREDAIVWRLSKDNDGQNEIFCAPGNAGTAKLATNVPISAENIDDLTAWAQVARPELVVIGPEAPLCSGLTDRLQAIGITVFGPSREAAQMEGSKQFAKEIMTAANVPTARSEVHTDADEAVAALKRFSFPVVIKADGLAAGKGVIIAQNHAEATEAIRSILSERRFGKAGAALLIETFLVGEEASILALVDGRNIALLPPAQDHKRINDNDEGPNTGGMGAYSPAPVVTDKVLQFSRERIFAPVVRELAKRKIVYRGVLYAGLMINGDDINVLEFNCRFGDPETEVILPRVEGNFTKMLLACARGELDPTQTRISESSAATVVMSSAGYPGSYKKGLPIRGLETLDGRENVIVFHAGTEAKDGQVVTAGGRVLSVTALGKTLREAVDTAYGAVRTISFDGAHFRTDIAQRAFNR